MLNRFNVLNDPINAIDPFGLESILPGSGFPDNNPGSWENPITWWWDYGGGATDFIGNYLNMRKANTVGSDKYFHCLANCQAAKRGQGGQDAARHFSETREWFDEHIKGDTTSACDQDRAANQQGRNADQNQSCKQACQSLRPSWLAPKW